MRISTKMTIQSILDIKEMEPYRDYLAYAKKGTEGVLTADEKKMTLEGVKEWGWSPEGISGGTECFLKAVQEARVKQYFLYSGEDTNDQRKEVNLIHIIPEDTKGEAYHQPFLIAAGGGYQAVCTIAESLPVAKHLLAMGHQVFILTYRVGEECILPRALADVAEAVRFIDRHKTEFSVRAEDLILCGFSAGANLLATWGCSSLGWTAFGVPRPKGLMLAYPLVKLEDAEANEIIVTMLGKDFKDLVNRYQIRLHIDSGYPATYLVCGKDDEMVPSNNSVCLKEILEQNHVPVMLELHEHAAHGFGSGEGTLAEGWVERAVCFLNNRES